MIGFVFHLAFPANESVIWAAAGAHDGIAMYELLVFGNRRGISIFWFHRFSSIGNHIGDNLSQILRTEIIDLEHCLLICRA